MVAQAAGSDDTSHQGRLVEGIDCGASGGSPMELTGFFDLEDVNGKKYLGVIVIGGLALLNGVCHDVGNFRIVRELNDERADSTSSAFFASGA
jgi:hypothetical protein